MSGVEYTWHERQQAYRRIQALAARLRDNDALLAAAIAGRLPVPGLADGYAAGGNSSGSGVSDPTSTAAAARERTLDANADEARQAIRHVMAALKSLGEADRIRARITTPPAARTTTPTRTTDTPAGVICAACERPLWCTSCLRSRPGTNQPIAHNPHACGTKKNRADLCSWCLRQWVANEELPDVRLVTWHADNPGRHLTPTIETDLLAKSRRKKGA